MIPDELQANIRFSGGNLLPRYHNKKHCLCGFTATDAARRLYILYFDRRVYRLQYNILAFIGFVDYLHIVNIADVATRLFLVQHAGTAHDGNIHIAPAEYENAQSNGQYRDNSSVTLHP